MRHRVAHRKLGRVTEHRISMLRNQATALLKYEHLTTTVPKAKELRPFVERLITVAKRGLAAGEANGRVLTARRLVMEDVQDREVVGKLFDTIAPRFAARPGPLLAAPELGTARAASRVWRGKIFPLTNLSSPGSIRESEKRETGRELQLLCPRCGKGEENTTKCPPPTV